MVFFVMGWVDNEGHIRKYFESEARVPYNYLGEEFVSSRIGNVKESNQERDISFCISSTSLLN